MTPDWAQQAPQRSAVIAAETGIACSFAALADTSARWANALRAAGLEVNDRIAVLTPNRIEAFCLYWAALCAGARYVLIDWHLRTDEAAYMLTNSKARILIETYAFGPETVYLCPAPLYHAAPLIWSMSVMRSGGTVVLVSRFDAQAALEAIDRYQVTLAQFVPTHFIRMLRLPESARSRHSLASVRRIVHAAAPCPTDTKRPCWSGSVRGSSSSTRVVKEPA